MAIIFGKLDISNEEDFLPLTLYFFYCNLNPNSGLRHIIKSSLIALWNFLSSPVSQFVTSSERPELTFS